MDNANVLNSWLVYCLCGGTLLFVFLFAVGTCRKVYRRAVEIGVSPGVLLQIRRSTIPLVLIPTLGISVGFIALAPILGIPWSCLRISIIGGRGYELMSANIAANGMGYTLATLADAGLDAIVNVMYVMSVCILPGLFILTLFGGKATTLSRTLLPQHSPYGKIAAACLPLNMLCVLIPDSVTVSAVHILVFGTSVCISLILLLLYRTLHWSWLKQYNSLICLLAGMASGVIYLRILPIS